MGFKNHLITKQKVFFVLLFSISFVLEGKISLKKKLFSMKKSTFKRKNKPSEEEGKKESEVSKSVVLPKREVLKGVKPSIQTLQMVVSSGLEDLDFVLQGGVVLGSLLMVEEDNKTRHFKTLMNYFLAEGIASEQAVFLTSSSEASILKHIPSIQEKEDVNEQKEESEKKKIEEMKIAWRYKAQLSEQQDALSFYSSSFYTRIAFILN